MAHQKGKGNMIGMVAGLVTIFAFLTGVHSLPSLLGKGTTTPVGLFGSDLGNAFPASILILSQVAYYLSFYGILRFVHVRLFKGEDLYLDESPDFFFILMFFALGCGISYVFMESFWGPVPQLLRENRHQVIMGFSLVSLVGNAITVGSALRCHM